MDKRKNILRVVAIIAVLFSAGVLASHCQSGYLLAMILGAIGGVLVSHIGRTM